MSNNNEETHSCGCGNAHEVPCECDSDCACHAVSQEDAIEVVDGDTRYNEMLDRYQRCLAEFDNYRKRTAKELSIRYDDGVRATCEKLLPLIDNFERAMEANENKGDSFYQGIALIARQFESTLESLGVKPIETEPGTPFDANFHHAVAHSADENFGQNEIVAVLQKGYTHKERVIRYAMVQVAN
ncbi:MAG: nucleotide exchange factor GrpE [Defluviitaleaceae bacterium]|nr:nucleotide exchange factor GrpE [Defluviitaleaceae bacterium]